MVRMAQPFSLNVPLVDGQGNWGTVGPKEYSDPPAAYRYCLTGDARLRLADGRTVRLDEVAPGAAPDSDTPVDVRVIGLRGEAVRASVLFHSGHHPTLRLRTRDGFEVTGTANHPLLCLERAGDGTPRLAWRTLGELRPGARVAVSRAIAPLGRAGGERLAGLLGARWATDACPSPCGAAAPPPSGPTSTRCTPPAAASAPRRASCRCRCGWRAARRPATCSCC